MAHVPHIAHLDMPFGVSGSAITNVIRDLSREHRAAGGRTTVILSDNRDVEVADAEVMAVDYTRNCPRQWFTRREYLLDAACGRAGRPRPYTSALFAPAVEALAQARPDWVLVHEGHYALAAIPGIPGIREALPDCGIALYLHNNLSRTYGRRELRRLTADCQLAVGVSQYMADHFRGRVGDEPRAVAVLNAVDGNTFKPVPRSSPVQRPIRVLFVGKISPHKGVHVLVDALKSVHRDYEVRVVGSSQHAAVEGLSDYERSLRQLAAQQRHPLTFLPFKPRQELAQEYAWADVTVVPSLFEEPFCLVVLEAMATGSAVVTTRRGGLLEAGGGAALTYDSSSGQLAHLLENLTPAVIATAQSAALERARATSWPLQYQALCRALSATEASSRPAR